MKRAAKIAQSIPTASPVVSTRPLIRPAVLLPRRPLSIAGPSTARYGPASPIRSYATVSSSTGAEPPSDALQTTEGRLFIPDAALGQGRRPLEIPDDVVVPPNVRFEGFENVEEPVPRGFRLHTPTIDTLSPISHPLSSLAATNPTSPSSADSISLPPHIFAQPLRRDILHRCVVWYLALLRSGNQSTKSRSTVNYSGRKLYRQKGTGKARVGDASSGIRRGGAPIFALNPRDHTQLLPRKFRALGLATALSSKLSSGLLRVVPDLNEAEWSGTAEARRALCDGLSASDEAWTEADELADISAVPGTAASEAETESNAAALVEGDSTADSGFIRRFGTPSDISVLFVHPQPTSEADDARLEQFTRAVRNLPGIEVLPMDEVEVYHVLKYKWCVLERGVVEGISESPVEDDLEELLLSDAEVERDGDRKAELESAVSDLQREKAETEGRPSAAL